MPSSEHFYSVSSSSTTSVCWVCYSCDWKDKESHFLLVPARISAYTDTQKISSVVWHVCRCHERLYEIIFCTTSFTFHFEFLRFFTSVAALLVNFNWSCFYLLAEFWTVFISKFRRLRLLLLSSRRLWTVPAVIVCWLMNSCCSCYYRLAVFWTPALPTVIILPSSELLLFLMLSSSCWLLNCCCSCCYLLAAFWTSKSIVPALALWLTSELIWTVPLQIFRSCHSSLRAASHHNTSSCRSPVP